MEGKYIVGTICLVAAFGCLWFYIQLFRVRKKIRPEQLGQYAIYSDIFLGFGLLFLIYAMDLMLLR